MGRVFNLTGQHGGFINCETLTALRITSKEGNRVPQCYQRYFRKTTTTDLEKNTKRKSFTAVEPPFLILGCLSTCCIHERQFVHNIIGYKSGVETKSKDPKIVEA